MTHLRIVALAVVGLSFFLSGCISTYRYESRGSVVDHSGNRQGALLYWGEDDGRLWYGKRYTARESGVDLKVCEAVDKSFVPASEGDSDLTLKSRSGDRQVATLEVSGNVKKLEPPKRLLPNESCGSILVGGVEVGMAELNEGAAPRLAILCESQRQPTRYPKFDLYAFSKITRSKVEKDRSPSSPCETAAPDVAP